MLPDYPSFKEELSEFLNRFSRMRLNQHLGFFRSAEKHRAFEGDRWALRREAGDVEQMAYDGLEVSRELPLAKVPTMTLVEILKELDGVAAEMASKQSVFAFKRLDETLEAAGQTMKLGGAKMSGEVLLQMLERMEMNFDEHGKPVGIALVTHPDNAAVGEAAQRSLLEDPILRAKHEELIERKRESWRAREAARRLVG